jgi:hypothetical protein
VPAAAVAAPAACAADPRLARRRRKTRELARFDHLVGEQDIADARGNERKRLVGLLAADPDRATRDLRLRDRGALVRLRVRAQAQARGRDRRRHRVEVGLERVEVDDERGRLDRVEGIACCGRDALRHPAK